MKGWNLTNKIAEEIEWETILFAQVFSSRKIWPIRKFICFVRSIKFIHLFLTFQGTKMWLEKVSNTKMVSHSSQRLCQLLWKAISIASMAPINSAKKAFWAPRGSAKHPKSAALWSLKISLAAPSMWCLTFPF